MFLNRTVHSLRVKVRSMAWPFPHLAAILFGLVALADHGYAQSSVSIGLYKAPAPLLNTLEVRVRPNGGAVTGVVSALTFTIRWNENSGASLGTSNQNINGNICPLVRVQLLPDPAGTLAFGGSRYLTYNAFGTSTLSSCTFQPGYNWPADQETVIMRIPVNPGASCARFNIVNDAFTGNENRDYFISVGGDDLTGTILSPVVEIANISGGGCDEDCAGVPNGTALPGTSCNDNDPCTVNDVYDANCDCRGAFDGTACPVDIGLFQSSADPNLLEVRVRPTGRSVTGSVSGLTFTLGWEATSGATLGDVDQIISGSDFCPLLQIPINESPDGEVDVNGNRYLTFNGFGFSFLTDCPTEPGYLWPAGQETVIMTIPVTPGLNCANFNIVNDGFTGPNNRDYFISEDGTERIGSIYSQPVIVGLCAQIYYSQASGDVSDPIWDIVRVGTAGAALFDATTTMVVQDDHVVNATSNRLLRDLFVENGGTLSLGTDAVFEVHGDTASFAGVLQAGANSRLELVGTDPTRIMAISAPLDLWDLRVNTTAGSSASGTIRIQGTLQLDGGAFDATAAEVRLRSSVIGTGRLGPMTAGVQYIGDLTVTRRVPDGATNWRLLSSSVADVSVVDLQDDFITAGYPGSQYPNFDSPVGSGILWPSIRWYDETNIGASVNSGLQGVLNSAEPLFPGQGFAVWCGDALGGTAAFTIDLVGEPLVAVTPIPLLMSWTNTGTPAVDGWNLVGNPVPSPIDFNLLDRGSDVADNVTFYDPATGNMATWDISANLGTNGATSTIQSSQAFWLKANGPNVNTTVSESDKVSGYGGGFFGGDQIPVSGHARLGISSALNGFSDESVILFFEGLPSYDPDDVVKFVFAHPSAPQIATVIDDGTLLAINAFGPFTTEIVIPVVVNVALSGTYTVTAEVFGELGLSCMLLEDLVSGALTPIGDGASVDVFIGANDDPETPRFLLRASAPLEVNVQDAVCHGEASGAVNVVGLSDGASILLADAWGSVLDTSVSLAGAATFEGMLAGNYELQVVGVGGCSSMNSQFSVVEPDPIELGTITQSMTSCPGAEDGVIAMSVQGGTPPYLFAWSNGSAAETLTASAGSYTLTVQDALGCSETSLGLAISDPLLTVPSVFFEGPVVAGVPHLFIGEPTGGMGLTWDMGDGTTAEGAFVVHTFNAPGTYWVSFTLTENGCQLQTLSEVQVELATGTRELAIERSVAWSTPNGLVFRQGGACVDRVELDVLDATGRLHRSFIVPCGSGAQLLPGVNLSTGIWFLRVQGANGTEVVRLPVVR